MDLISEEPKQSFTRELYVKAVLSGIKEKNLTSENIHGYNKLYVWVDYSGGQGFHWENSMRRTSLTEMELAL